VLLSYKEAQDSGADSFSENVTEQALSKKQNNNGTVILIKEHYRGLL
jgi:hypothetical protein